MTRKSTLSAWASRLGADLPASSTAAQLEAGINQAIDNLMTPVSGPTTTLSEGIRNNIAVLRQELPGTISAITANLRS